MVKHHAMKMWEWRYSFSYSWHLLKVKVSSQLHALFALQWSMSLPIVSCHTKSHKTELSFNPTFLNFHDFYYTCRYLWQKFSQCFNFLLLLNRQILNNEVRQFLGCCRPLFTSMYISPLFKKWDIQNLVYSISFSQGIYLFKVYTYICKPFF